ncbi:MAG: 1-aminocyclopropane-1-carboxylate deaminase/D-cysteine desulfhydrase, partial [Chloroflexota bacterium]
MLDALPRYPLAALPTPLEGAPNLSAQLGIEVLIKRDDLTGLAMGGNKARKLEYIVADAKAQGADMLLTTAAAQSNFCRMTAGSARRAGMQAGLLLRGSGQEAAQGNLLLDYLLGADVRFTEDMDPYSTGTHDRLLAWEDEARAAGRHPYLVYIHGGSRAGSLATAGYVAGALELARQLQAMEKRPRHLYVAVGSGGTLAGLLIGLRMARLELRTVGVCVGTLSDTMAPKTLEFIGHACQLIGAPRPPDTDLILEDGQRGEAYGVPTAAGITAINLLART